MLWFSLGTAAELIKVYPLLFYADKRGMDWIALSSGQSGINLLNQWRDFKLPEVKLIPIIESQKDLETSSGAFSWFIKANTISLSMFRNKLVSKICLSPKKGDFWIVHGDTLSTVFGAILARRLSLTLVHLEAGLRSTKLFQPFPEELNRRFTSRLVNIHLAQDDVAVNNLIKAKVGGEIVSTRANTLLDSIKLILDGFEHKAPNNGPYVVANLHRFENLTSRPRWAVLIETLIKAAKTRKVFCVMHPITKSKLDSLPEVKNRLISAGVELLPRLPFTEFIFLLANSEYVLSDGGSNQEECFYLGKPCLLLRNSTERQEGLGGCCVLSKFDEELIDEFIAHPENYKRDSLTADFSPAEIILNKLGGVG